MSSPPGALVQDLIERPLPDLRRYVRQGLPVPAARLVESIRNEAGRFYHTDAAAARRIARRALELGRLSGDPVAIGWGNRAMAEALFLSGRMREADPYYERAAAAWKGEPAAGLLGQLLVGRTHQLALLGRYREAAAAAGEARRLLEAADDRAYLAKLAMNLGNVHFQRDRYGPALEEYDRAAAIFSRLQVRDQVVIGVEINRGVALSQLDRDEEALALFGRLEEECGRLGHGLLLAQTRMNAAYVHSQRADFDRALRDLAGAADYFLQTEHPSFLAECYLNRAEIYHQLNLHREALDLTEQAVPLFSREGMTYDHALANAQAALSCLALGELPAAIRRIRRSRALFEREKNRSRVAWMEILWAEALSRRRRVPPEAVERARGAMETFVRLGLVRWEATAAVLLDRLEGERLPPARRIERLRRLLRRIPARIYPITTYRVLESLGMAQERSRRLQAAASTYRRALTHLEDLRVRIPTEDSKIAFLQDKTYLYHRLLALELSRSRPSIERLFEWMERSRAQSLWDRLRDPASYLTPAGGGEGFRSEEIDRKLPDLRRRLSWLHTRLSRLELGSPAEQAHAPVLRRELAEAEKAWARRLRERAERGSGSGRGESGDRRIEAEVPTLREVSRSLPEGWGFLSYYIGPDLALAVVVTRGGMVWRRLAPDLGARLARLVERLDFQWGAAALAGVRRTQTARGGSRLPSMPRALQSATDAILGEICGLLWKPIEEAGPSPSLRWIVSPHGPIHRIPLHALREPAGYLVERTDLTTVPSARIWRGLPDPASNGGRVAWVGGVPSPQLPGVAQEVERIARRLEGWRVTTDLAPTCETFRREGERCHLLHLAAHGSLRIDNPAYSFLQLHDGPLFVHDLADFRIPRATVILSACSSGRGAAPVGEEWIGLARGFVRGGASTVVASLWPIQEEPTLELMDRFYARYAAGSSAPEALGQAMRRLIPLHPHPWAWASFGVLGGV